MKAVALSLLAAVVLASAAAGGRSGPPGNWTRISETNGVNIDEVGLARTADGVLHVAWVKKEAGNREGIFHTAIGANATVSGSPVAIATGWASINFPDLIRTADGGLRAFFGGIRSTSSGETNNALNTAAAPASGTSWSLQGGSVSKTTVTYATTVGAGLATDGTPVTAWEDASPNANGFHFGVDKNGPEFGYERSGCCVYKPDVGVDSSTGRIVIAWYSNVTNKAGVYAREISTGGPGAESLVPTSATANRENALSVSQRIGITGRIGGPGIYVGFGSGYPTYDSVKIWRYGDGAPLVSIAARGAKYVNLAAGPEGRLWLMWVRNNRVFATRTNKAATRAGRVVSAAPPSGTSSFWRLAGEGSVGALDVLLHVSTPGSLATWHSRILPGLLLTAKGAKKKATVTVTDAGDPVAGARVKVGKRTATTNASGKATLKLKKGAYPVVATRAGYQAASARVRVR